MFALALVSCFDEPRPSEPTTTSFVVRREIPLGSQPQIDLLFVVDDSPSMAAHRETLRFNMRVFVQSLHTLGGPLPDLHIGFITTDADSPDAGVLRASPSVAGRFIVDSQTATGGREGNYNGALEDVVVESFDGLGMTGSSIPRPLDALRRALGEPANDGFLREHAQLAIVILTANDDSSPLPVEELALVIKATKHDPGLVVVGGAFGPATAPSCTDDDPPRSALPAIRLHAFLDQFPNRSASTSICNDNLDGALSGLASLIRTSIGSPCFDVPLLDLDPVRGGAQYECTVMIRRGSDEEVVPPCNPKGTTRQCWRITRDLTNCPSDDHLRIDLDSFFPTVVPATEVIECVADGTGML